MPSAKLAAGVLFCFLSPVCFLAFETRALAQISVEPDIGFHGLFQLGRSFPFRAVVGNAGPPATGTVEVAVWKRKTSQDIGLYPLRYRREVVLPANTRKTVRFTINPDSLSRPLEIRFFNSREKVIKQVDLRRHFSPTPLVLLVTERGLSPISLPPGFQNPVVPLSLRELPPDARSYGGVLAVLFYEQSLRDLSEAQAAALESWLSSGGRMVILGSLHYALYQEPTISRFLPVKVKGIKRVRSVRSLERAYGGGTGLLNDLWAQKGDLVAGKVLLEASGTPILVELKRGKGKIVYLTVDAGRPPLSRWAGLAPLFADLLRASPDMESADQPVWNDAVVSRLLSNVYFSRGPPRALFFWLGLYLGGLGLWAWLWMKWKARRRILLLSFLLFVGSASAAGYFHLDQGGDLPDGVLFASRVLDGLRDGYVEVQSNLALFSSRRRSYGIAVESGWADFEMHFPSSHKVQDDPILVQDELSSTRFRFSLKAWDYRLFRLRSVWRFPIHAEARRRGKTILVKLANQSPSELSDSWLLAFGQPFYWGKLSPGAIEAREFHLESEERRDHKIAARGVRFDDRVREILFRHSFFPEDRGVERWSERVLFLGWVQEGPQEAWLNDQRIVPYRYTLYRAMVPWSGEDEEGG